MRRSRWLILVAIVGIVFAIGATYLKRKETLVRNTPAPPQRLETGVDGRANDWIYTQSDGAKPRVTVRARSQRLIKAPSVMELEGVQLQLFHKDGAQFDLVKCEKAQFDLAAKSLYSDGDVEITMGVPADDEAAGRIIKIHTSGVRFASETGKAFTDRQATFEFDKGGGTAVGAEYDPQARELRLRSEVSLDWRGNAPGAKPIHIEAGEAVYLETESKVLLTPWSKMTRDTLRMEGGASQVLLEHGVVQEVTSQAAHGVQADPSRKVEFAAGNLVMKMGEGMAVKSIAGQQNGKLISTAQTMRTTVTADRMDLTFDTAAKESTLSSAVARGKSVAEAQPIPQAGQLTPDTRVLRSEVIHLNMRTGGQEVDKIETEGPGTIDFLPNRPAQPKRQMKGDKIWIAYGAENRVKSLLSSNVTTRTEKPGQPPMLTDSEALLAQFDPQTSELAQLDQTGKFHYEEGTRRASADHAILEQAKDLMTLAGSARIADPTGSAAADRIVMNQKSGDFTADGHVATTRLPDQKGSSTAMLSNSEVMQARAQHMTSGANNTKIHYDGSAVAWQGANRVEADRIEIDRARQVFEAHGKVISQFVDQPAKGNKKAPAALIFTVVRAPDLIYTGEARIADYQGGAVLTRPGMTVNGAQIRAFLKDSPSDSSLDKAIADGAVKIVSNADQRTRTGTSEHAEYYADDQKVILNGGDALLVDTLRGQTRGKQLTWFANNDRLLVNGVENRPADSLLRKK